MIPHPTAGDIAPILQLPDDAGDGVGSFLVLVGKTLDRKIPIIRSGQHIGHEPFRLEAQFGIDQMMIGHDRVIIHLGYPYNRHDILLSAGPFTANIFVRCLDVDLRNKKDAQNNHNSERLLRQHPSKELLTGMQSSLKTE